ncbi:MAG TPA: hypothetical protein PLX23_08650, partial [Candidatus Hydrogenedens sp.]|nr:hypothetical protein [Candidatus Hydrogenedens sp.]
MFTKTSEVWDENKRVSLVWSSTAILCLILCSLTGCGPSLKTVQRTSDQDKLSRIAIEAKDSNVRRAAVDRISDQSL